MFEFLLIDLDDTILDFKKAERLAIAKTITSFGLEATPETLHRYHLINKEHWERLERKEITREQVLVGRFDVLFQEMGISVDPVLCARTYEGNLSQGHYFLPGAFETLEELAKNYRLFLVSNGTSRVQAGRLKSAAISHFFETIFISQDIGVNKPDKLYFDRCFAQIPDFISEKALIVGDSLSSDILGGKNAGIATCWVNPEGKNAPENLQPDYQIESLSQLPKLLRQG